MREATVLLIEGKRAGNNTLSTSLAKEGLHLCIFNTGNAAYTWAAKHAVEIVVFDASTMRSNGVRSCRRLRSVLPDTPIIHCREEGELEDRSAEADIYLERPFTARKVLNRIRTLLPTDDWKEEIARAGDLTFYPTKRSIDVNGQGEQRLTPKLASLLNVFLRNPNEILPREMLMRDVWDTDFMGDTRTLDVHIRWVREVIEKDPANPVLLKTVRGKGYIFSIPAVED
ncbi:MAG: response regulator transcription factor [Candidatus Promineifilaceae bacterium]